MHPVNPLVQAGSSQLTLINPESREEQLQQQVVQAFLKTMSQIRLSPKEENRSMVCGNRSNTLPQIYPGQGFGSGKTFTVIYNIGAKDAVVDAILAVMLRNSWDSGDSDFRPPLSIQQLMLEISAQDSMFQMSAQDSMLQSLPRYLPLPVAAVTPSTCVPALEQNITVRKDLGYGNTLYVRGDPNANVDPRLSWEQGQPMTCIGTDEWTFGIKVPLGEFVEYKCFINDDLEQGLAQDVSAQNPYGNSVFISE